MRTLFTFSGPPETRQDFPSEAREVWADRVRVRGGLFQYVAEALGAYENAAAALLDASYPVEGPEGVLLENMRRVQVVHVTSSGTRLHAPITPATTPFWGVPFQASHLTALPGGCTLLLLRPGHASEVPLVCHTLAVGGLTLLCTAPPNLGYLGNTDAGILGSAAPVSMLVPDPANTSVMIKSVPGWLADDISDRVPRSAL